MKRTKPLRRTAMRKKSRRSKKSQGHLFPKGVDEQYRSWIRRQPCILAWRRLEDEPNKGLLHYCELPISACHVRSRGAGGTDAENLYPGCVVAHMAQHILGRRTFARRWGVDIQAVAVRLWEQYKREQISGYLTDTEL